jgi:hypothetical protein
MQHNTEELRRVWSRRKRSRVAVDGDAVHNALLLEEAPTALGFIEDPDAQRRYYYHN